MVRISALALVALAAVGTGCGANPLEGTWTHTLKVSGVTMKEVVTLGTDGNVSETLTSSACPGTETISGFSWTSSATYLNVTGTQTCSGSCAAMESVEAMTYIVDVLPVWMLFCQPVPEGSIVPVTYSACDYSLDDGDDSLTIAACASASTNPQAGSIVLTRKQ